MIRLSASIGVLDLIGTHGIRGIALPTRPMTTTVASSTIHTLGSALRAGGLIARAGQGAGGLGQAGQCSQGAASQGRAGSYVYIVRTS